MTEKLEYRVITERLMERVDQSSSDCWLWTGCVNNYGYGVMSVDNRRQYTHRLAYIAFVGPIPDGLVLDHLCRVPRCCNPDHLEAVTQSINVRRGLGNGLAERTHCPHGHAYADHAWTNSKGGKRCRVCLSHNQRTYRARLKQEATS